MDQQIVNEQSSTKLSQIIAQNVNRVFVINRGQQENFDLFTVIKNLIKIIRKNLKTQLECNLSQQATYLTEAIKLTWICIKATCISTPKQKS